MPILQIKSFQDISNYPTPSDVGGIITYGYDTFGDGGGGCYRRSTVVPSHQGYAISATGGIFVLCDDALYVESFGAKGDNITDDTNAIISALNAANVVKLRSKTYRVTSPIVIPSNTSLIGEGASIIRGDNIIGSVVEFASSSGIAQNGRISDITISGSASYSGLHVGAHVFAKVHRVGIYDLTSQNGFVFENTWGSSFRDLAVIDGPSKHVSNANFVCGGSYNANDAANWYTNSLATYNFLLDQYSTTITTSAKGNNFAALTAQGGRYGLFVGQFGQSVINGFYTENVVTALQLGDAGNNRQAVGITLNSPLLAGPYANHPQFASRLAVAEFDNAVSCTLNSPSFTGDYQVANTAPITIIGDGTGASVILIVDAAGIPIAAYPVCPGTGYTSASASVGGAGSGAYVSLVVSGGGVTGAFVSGGTGYVPSVCPVAVRFNRVRRSSIINPYHVGYGSYTPLYPWVVKKPGASTSEAITILGDISWLGGNSAWENHADVKKVQGFSNLMVVHEWNGANPPGLVTQSFTPVTI